MTVKNYVDIEIDNIRTYDAPDYVDAFVSSATAVLANGTMREATEVELNTLSEDRELVYGLILKRLY